MRENRYISVATIFAAASFLNVAVVLSDEPVSPKQADARSAALPAHSVVADEIADTPLEIARDRANVMHRVYAATLEVLHHRYFHGERAVVPARAMEDIFSEIQQQSGVEARWISVNMKPMSIGHAPKSDFEIRAAKEIAAGNDQHEEVADGYYRRAGAIPLGSGCISCHGGHFKEPSKAPKYAGLIISIPIRTSDSDTPNP